jgi:CRISPR/Cas system-associated protein Cas5 (RAMP superfamily)
MGYLDTLNTMQRAQPREELPKNLNLSPDAVNDLNNMFKRYREINDARVFEMQKILAETTQKLTRLTEMVERVGDSERIQKTREAIWGQSNSKKEPSEKPIDRTGVAPKDVQIEKIFNFAPGGMGSNTNRFR